MAEIMTASPNRDLEMLVESMDTRHLIDVADDMVSLLQCIRETLWDRLGYQKTLEVRYTVQALMEQCSGYTRTWMEFIFEKEKELVAERTPEAQETQTDQ